MGRKVFRDSALAVGFVVVLAAPYATAHNFKYPHPTVDNGTTIQITIQIPKDEGSEDFTITYTDPTTHKDVTIPVSTGSRSGTAVVPLRPENNTLVTIKNVTMGENFKHSFMASIFSPPSNAVISAFSINPNSSLTLAGSTFALSGGFASVSTSVDYNPASPNFGALGGFVHNFSIQGVGAGGTIHITVAGTPTYTINLASVWAQPLPSGGLSVPFTLAFSGTLTFNSLSSPYSGTFNGTNTFFPNGSETVQGPFQLATAFGPVNGMLSATAARSQITPEPSTLTLLGIGLVGVASCARRSGRKKALVL